MHIVRDDNFYCDMRFIRMVHYYYYYPVIMQVTFQMAVLKFKFLNCLLHYHFMLYSSKKFPKLDCKGAQMSLVFQKAKPRLANFQYLLS